MNQLKTILITGTSSGIGKATAEYFSTKGWNVAATMLYPEKDNEVKNYINTKIYPLDVTSGNSILEAMSAAIKDFGQIDVVVNNAGYGVEGIFEAMSDEVIEKQFNTNLFGLMRVTRSFITYFRTHKIKGTIVQIGSMGGRLTFPLYSIYHGTKYAVEGFTESLQFEVKPLGIKLKIIEPGAIKTEFFGAGRQFINAENTDEYSEFVEKCTSFTRKNGQNGDDPLLVAKTIFRAVTDSREKLRYPVGYPAPLLLMLREFIPDSLYFSLIRKYFKI